MAGIKKVRFIKKPKKQNLLRQIFENSSSLSGMLEDWLLPKAYF